MPKINIIAYDAEREITFTPEPLLSVRDILDAAGIQVRCGCQGNGGCGLCLIQIISGDIRGPTKNELILLSPDQLGRNIRLACQVIPERDISLQIIGIAPASGWRDLDSIPCTPSQLPPAGTQQAKNAYGLAVDLGTTHISLSLWDLKQGRRLAARTGMNPQAISGADVVTRLIAASKSEEARRKLARIALGAVNEALSEMCAQKDIDPEKVAHVTFVGNTPMMTLLTESDPRLLLQPQYWTQPFRCKLDDPRPRALVMGIDPDAVIDIASPLAGFVGSDLLAGVISTRLMDNPGALLIDFGTNSEMALWDGKTLWVTSAAGGPAFESSQTQCGMPAGAGAISSVSIGKKSSELRYRVIGGGEAKGLCGSGLVDLIAVLRRRGDLTPTGRFKSDEEDGFVLQAENPFIHLTKKDVDMFQRAKAAIGVGVKTLLSSAGMSAGELSRICISGTFGQNLNIRNAQSIGLLPEVRRERVELCGNTALAGCERLLLSPTGSASMESLRERAEIINLSGLRDFEDLFMENLYLRPLATEGQ